MAMRDVIVHMQVDEDEWNRRVRPEIPLAESIAGFVRAAVETPPNRDRDGECALVIVDVDISISL
jgi:hypothetical protein